MLRERCAANHDLVRLPNLHLQCDRFLSFASFPFFFFFFFNLLFFQSPHTRSLLFLSFSRKIFERIIRFYFFLFFVSNLLLFFSRKRDWRKILKGIIRFSPFFFSRRRKKKKLTRGKSFSEGRVIPLFSRLDQLFFFFFFRVTFRTSSLESESCSRERDLEGSISTFRWI